MGARTTWEIRTDSEGPSIYLYSHWGGDSKWSDTRRALEQAEPRWGDSTYGARIFISQIIGTQWDSETGFGIMAGEPGEVPFEEEYFRMVVDFSNQTILVSGEEITFRDFLVSENKSDTLVELFWGGGNNS